jgi:glucosamine-6-phosphate deaminase
MSLTREFKAGKLNVKIYSNREEMGKAAARDAAAAINALLSEKSEINIIFAAAPSQNEFLAALAADKSVDFTKINAFHMDEYIGLSKDAPQGFGNFLRDRLFGLVPFKSVNYLNPSADNPEAECERYSKLLSDNPPDMVCMGIGENGHIAFNDPPVADFNDKKLVKVVELELVCRNQQVNDGCFASIDEVPTHALSLTVPTLMKPKYVLCMVPAATKAQAVYNTINSPEISEKCPATILRTHDNATLYLEPDSAKLL